MKLMFAVALAILLNSLPTFTTSFFEQDAFLPLADSHVVMSNVVKLVRATSMIKKKSESKSLFAVNSKHSVSRKRVSDFYHILYYSAFHSHFNFKLYPTPPPTHS